MSLSEEYIQSLKLKNAQWLSDGTTVVNRRIKLSDIVDGFAEFVESRDKFTVKSSFEYIKLKYAVSREELMSYNRARKLVIARNNLMYLLRHEVKMKYEAIGLELNRTHATIIHGVKAHEKKIQSKRSAESVEGESVLYFQGWRS